jgi:proline iminopeptidase
MNGYLDNSGREDALSGGARMIAVETPKGPYRVWVKRTGNNPRLRVLLLHGGPGATHEYLEACDSYLPGAGIEYYYYDQLGSGFSDKPEEPSLWDLDRFVDGSRSAGPSGSTRPLSCCTGTRGAGCWPSSTRCITSSTCAGW